MTYKEKIKDFESIEGLVSEIISDKKTRDILSRRFPARLIFLQRFETFRSLIDKLSSLNVEIYDLEKDLPNPDGWITKDSLINVLSNIKKDAAVVPFSEMVRFYSEPDFKNFFNRLLLIENTSDLSMRIYLPLIGIEQRFEKDFYQSFSRNNECAPIWSILKEQPNSIVVYLSTIKSLSKIPNYKTLSNTEEWLKFWKKNSPCDVICSSKPLNLFYKNTYPDTIFTIEQVNNPKELIERIIKKEIPIPYLDNESFFWEKLINYINRDLDDFNKFVKNYFKVTVLNINTFIDNWIKTDDLFEKWLLKYYILSQTCLSTKYLYSVLASTNDYSDHNFLKSLYLTIFSLEINKDLTEDRYRLIKQFFQYKSVALSEEAIQELKSKISAIKDSNLVLSLTTGLFDFEKSYIFQLFANNKELRHDELMQRFPDISSYISMPTFENLKNDQLWVYEYLNEYKESKLSNKVTDKLMKILTELNGDQDSFFNWYYSFESIHSLLHSQKVDKIFWIDALGLEWVSFIENYLNHNGGDLKVISNFIGTANLPTSTGQNRFPTTKYIQDFDSYIHDNPYIYPDSIINQFNEIKKIIDTHFALDSNQTIAIVSDHGLTSLSRLVDSKKYGKNDSHEGRYIEVDDKSHSIDSDYIIHESEIDKKHYLIALKHNSLGNKPIREVHGGCTPEEVFVPLIILSNKKDVYEIQYSINIDKTEISKKEPLLSIDITPKPRSANYQLANKTQKLNFNNTTKKWEGIIDKSIVGKNSIKVIVGKTEKSFDINIITGLIEEDLF